MGGPSLPPLSFSIFYLFIYLSYYSLAPTNLLYKPSRAIKMKTTGDKTRESPVMVCTGYRRKEKTEDQDSHKQLRKS